MGIQERAKEAAEKAFVAVEDFLVINNPLLTEGQKRRGVSTYKFQAVSDVFKDYPEGDLILDVPEGSLPNVPEDLRTEATSLDVVGSNVWAIEHVPEHLRTKELCMEAVKDGILKYESGKNEPDQEVTPTTPKF